MAIPQAQKDEVEKQHDDTSRVRSWLARFDEPQIQQRNDSPDSCRYTRRETTIPSSEKSSLKRPADHFHGLSKSTESLYRGDICAKRTRYAERAWDLDSNRYAASQDTRPSTPSPERRNTATDPTRYQPFAQYYDNIGSSQQGNSPDFGEHRHGMPSSQISGSKNDNLHDVGQKGESESGLLCESSLINIKSDVAYKTRKTHKLICNTDEVAAWPRAGSSCPELLSEEMEVLAKKVEKMEMEMKRTNWSGRRSGRRSRKSRKKGRGGGV